MRCVRIDWLKLYTSGGICQVNNKNNMLNVALKPVQKLQILDLRVFRADGQHFDGPARRLAGFRCVERAIPRQGYEVFLDDRQVDVVRSGGFSPSLKVGIGTTFLPTDTAAPGTEIELAIRGTRVRAEVVKMPFYTDGSVRKA